jgi:hypothetical protein
MLAFASPKLPSISQALPSPAPLGVAEAQALASEVPCALLDVRERQSSDQHGRLSGSGPTLPGPAFNAFLRQLDGPDGPPAVAIERLDSGHCPALAVIGDLVRRSRERGGLRLGLPNSPIPVGGRLVVNVQSVPDGALYADLYSADGSVQHLHRGYFLRSRGATDVPITGTVSGSPGPSLLVVMAAPASLDLESRPTRERDADYLTALQHALTRLAAGVPEPRADVVLLSIVAAARPPAAPPVASARNRVPGPVDARCANIVAQVALGEGLSEADRKVLQTSCGH